MFLWKKPERARLRYIGAAGLTLECIKAVECYITLQGIPDKVILLRSERHWHEGAMDFAFLFEKEETENPLTIVLDGFSNVGSGKAIEGLSNIVSLLVWHEVIVFYEIEISREIMVRIRNEILTIQDLEFIQTSSSCGNPRQYILFNDAVFQNPWKKRKVTLPLSLLDDRLIDGGKEILENPNASERVVFEGFRRLEQILSHRAAEFDKELVKLDTVKLIDACFDKDKGFLVWPNVKPGIVDGRRQLFRGAFQAIRNPLSHREPDYDFHRDIRQLMILNELYFLEKQAVNISEYNMQLFAHGVKSLINKEDLNSG